MEGLIFGILRYATTSLDKVAREETHTQDLIHPNPFSKSFVVIFQYPLKRLCFSHHVFSYILACKRSRS